MDWSLEEERGENLRVWVWRKKKSGSFIKTGNIRRCMWSEKRVEIEDKQVMIPLFWLTAVGKYRAGSCKDRIKSMEHRLRMEIKTWELVLRRSCLGWWYSVWLPSAGTEESFENAAIAGHKIENNMVNEKGSQPEAWAESQIHQCQSEECWASVYPGFRRHRTQEGNGSTVRVMETNADFKLKFHSATKWLKRNYFLFPFANCDNKTIKDKTYYLFPLWYAKCYAKSFKNIILFSFHKTLMK